MRPLAADRDLRLSSSPIGVCYVLADRQRLKQVLINLVSNAIKYNRVGGSVTIFCSEANARLRVEIKDTGTGIPADLISELFTPFARLGAERSAVEGTGLGLAVARRLVEAMDGAIGVESANREGSTFWIEFPVTESPLAREDLVENEPAVEAILPTEKRCVLYIEDNLSNLRLIEHVLVHRPAVELISARTARDGIRLAEAHLPDLILLDLNLPDMHGYEVLQHLRDGPGGADIPVVVVSADAMATQKDRLLEAGAADYLTKPLDIKKFLATLDRALERTGERNS
jgi:CheY-like chemotaxis protein